MPDSEIWKPKIALAITLTQGRAVRRFSVDLEAELAALGVEAALRRGHAARRAAARRRQRASSATRGAAVCPRRRRRRAASRSAATCTSSARPSAVKTARARLDSAAFSDGATSCVAQQVEAGRVVARKAVLRLLRDAVAQRLDLALQRHQVGVGLAVEHHQVAGHAAEAPPGLGAQQRVDQALCRSIEWMWTSTIGLSPEMPKRQIWRRSIRPRSRITRGVV